jgi:hypothetical protein
MQRQAETSLAFDEAAGEPLGRLLGVLKAQGYRFITPTPETHARVLARQPHRRAQDVRDVLGWNLPFHPGLLDAELSALLGESGALVEEGPFLRSTLRVASLGDDLYLHSGFPPGRESVFFGPDTYRFARFLAAELHGEIEASSLVDLGAGAGAGAVVAARRLSPARVVLTDINRKAIELARINLRCAGVDAEFRCRDATVPLDGPVDLVIANPPFIAGADRIYSGGGDLLGARASIDWAIAGAAQLTRGGRMLLYTGSAIAHGVDALSAALRRHLDPQEYQLDYAEIDPDIFGESLDLEPYRDIERIAAVGAVIVRRAS